MEKLTFPEADHLLVRPLLECEDRELLDLWQRNRDRGRYFVQIFCRHSPLVYNLICDSFDREFIANHFFSLIWQAIFEQLPTLKLDSGSSSEFQSLSHWLIYLTASVIRENESVEGEAIATPFPARYLPLKFYLQEALNQLLPLYRLVLLLSEKFNWHERQIIDYLGQRGETIETEDLKAYLAEASALMFQNIPEDIKSIYLEDLGEKESQA